MHRRSAMRFRVGSLSLLATVISCSSGNLEGGAGSSGGDGGGGTGGVAGTAAAAGHGGSGGGGGDGATAGGGRGGDGGSMAGAGGGAGGIGGTGGGAVAGMAGSGGPAGSSAGGRGGAGGVLVTGHGGTGGAPSDQPCPAGVVVTPTSRSLILGADGMPLLASVAAPVVVTEIQRATSGVISRVTLMQETSSQQWTWAPWIQDLPDDRIKVGDHFDLNVDARACAYPTTTDACQTVVLARGGSLIVFTSQQSGPTPLPALDSWGFSIASAGIICSTGGFPGCRTVIIAAKVTVGAETLTLVPGQSGAIGDLSFRLASYGSPSGCDPVGWFTMSGFRTP